MTTDTTKQRAEISEIKLAIVSAIPIGVDHRNILIALADLVADFTRQCFTGDKSQRR